MLVRFSAVLASLAAAGFVGACAEEAENPAKSFATVLEAPPYQPIERLGPEPYVPSLQDRRWRHADEVEQRHLSMLRRLKRGEMGNFGGVEWQWRDGPQNDGLGALTGIAYFLRDPEESLRRYTTDPLFGSAEGDFSRVEQDEVAREWAQTIGHEIASAGFGNISTPWLDIAISRSRFEEMREAEGWDIPVNLTLRFNSDAESDLPALPSALTGDIRVFPVSDRMSGPTPDLASYDAIVLRDGCFFIDEEGEDDPLAMFPSGVGIYRDDEGFLAFRSRYSDRQQRLARVGTQMQLGYRIDIADPPEQLQEACGRHRAVLVRTLDQAAGYGGVWHAVKQYAQDEGISESEAMRQANECLLEQEQRLADRRLRGAEYKPALCPQTSHVPPPPPAIEETRRI